MASAGQPAHRRWRCLFPRAKLTVWLSFLERLMAELSCSSTGPLASMLAPLSSFPCWLSGWTRLTQQRGAYRRVWGSQTPQGAGLIGHGGRSASAQACVPGLLSARWLI